MNKIVEEEGLDKQETEEEQKKKQSILERFGFLSKAKDVIGNIAAAPLNTFVDILESADRAIYQMMFKTELKDDSDGKEYNGFMDMIAGKLSKVTDKIGDKITEILDPIKKSLGIDDTFKERTKDSLICL